MKKMKRFLTIFIAASMIISASAALSGCEIKGHLPEDSYVSPLRNTGDNADESISDSEESAVSENDFFNTDSENKTESKSESKAESKSASKTESKAESKSASKAESKTASKSASKTESKAESKSASKTESIADGSIASRTESKDENNNESKSEDESALYKDMVSLIKDSEVLGYTVTKLAGSDDEHLIIAYGKTDKDFDTDSESENIIIIDQELYAKEQAEKAAALEEEKESSRIYSVYKIDGDRVVPEGDIDGYYTTAYTSPITSTPGIYFAHKKKWRYGLIEIADGSAFVNFTNEGSVENEDDPFPPLPGTELDFSAPKKLDLIKKYK